MTECRQTLTVASSHPLRVALLTLLVFSSFSVTAVADELYFSPEAINAWPTRSFEGETEYRLIERDGKRVLQARAKD